MKHPPCYGCSDRRSGCHGGCDKYTEWAMSNTAKAKDRNERLADDFLYLGAVKGRKNKERSKQK